MRHVARRNNGFPEPPLTMWFESQVSRQFSYVSEIPIGAPKTPKRPFGADRTEPVVTLEIFHRILAKRLLSSRTESGDRIRGKSAENRAIFCEKTARNRVHVTTVKLNLVTYAISACVLFWNERDRSALKWFYVYSGPVKLRLRAGRVSIVVRVEECAGPLDICLAVQDVVVGRWRGAAPQADSSLFTTQTCFFHARSRDELYQIGIAIPMVCFDWWRLIIAV